jgi:tetratricopeptide (TPR) repeat protein
MDKKTLCDWADDLNFVKVFGALDKLEIVEKTLYVGLKKRFIAGDKTYEFADQVKIYISLLDIPENETIVSKPQPSSTELGLASFGLAELLKGEVTPENAAKMKEAWNRIREKIEADMNQKIDPKTTTDFFFERILGTDKLNKTDVSDIRNLLKANALFYPYQCLIVSALMLSLMRKYDENRIDLLIDALNENVPHVWQRALLALVLGLTGREQKIQANSALTNRLRDLQTKPAVQVALLSIYKALYEMEVNKVFEKDELNQILLKYRQYGFFAESGKPQYWFLPFYDAPELLAFFEDREINLNHQKLIDLLASPYELTFSDSNKYALCFATATLYDFQIKRCFEIFEMEIVEIEKLSHDPIEKLGIDNAIFSNLLKDIWYFRHFYSDKELAQVFEKQQVLQNTSLLDLLATDQSKADFLYEQALLLDIPSEEIKAYQQVLRLNPYKHEAWNNLGIAYRKQGNYEQAIESYRKAIAIKADFHETWNNLGFVYDEQGNYEKAIESYRKAIEIKPDYDAAWYNLVIAYKNQQNYAQAIDAYRKAIEIKPDDHEVWFSLGLVYFNQGNYEQAIESYRKAIEINADDHEAWYNLGVVYGKQGNYEQAIESYRKAIEIKADSHEAWCNLGVVYSDQGNYEQAIESYRKAIEIKDDYQKAWYNLGVAYVYSKDWQNAEQSFLKALAIKPDDDSPIYNLACLFSLQNNKEKALSYLQKAISLNSKYKQQAAEDTDFQWLWEDEEFKKMVA